jgi:hypothetical protein
MPNLSQIETLSHIDERPDAESLLSLSDEHTDAWSFLWFTSNMTSNAENRLPT